jgi:hypothetical protein
MRKSSLNPEYLEYLLCLCDMALAHVCQSIDGIPENIVRITRPYISQDNGGFGLLGHAFPHTEITSISSIMLSSQKESEMNNDSLVVRQQRLNATFFSGVYPSIVKKASDDYAKVEHYRKLPSLNYDDRAHLVRQYKTGRCLDLSALALNFLKHMPVKYPVSVEMFDGYNNNFDHVFLVLGRPPYTDPLNFADWPEDTVILDPWLRCRFLLKQLPEYWRDMAYLNNWAGMRTWPQLNQIMDEQTLPDENHPFFTKLIAELRTRELLLPKEVKQQLQLESRSCEARRMGR